MLRFGTSGIRGLVEDLTDHAVYRLGRSYAAFLQARDAPRTVFVAGDLRASTPGITRALTTGLTDGGTEVIFCGSLPTPALTLHAVGRGSGSVMVTGSHIPADRNGLKFNTPVGELLREHEGEILNVFEGLRDDPGRPFDEAGAFVDAALPLPTPQTAAQRQYVERYVTFFGPGSLDGMRVVVHQHSSVARDLLPEILRQLGAYVAVRGRSAVFVPVDTEAVDDDPRYRLWIADHGADALVSTDGDADRPLVIDANGRQVRGDVLGILVAEALQAKTVICSLNCNSAVDQMGTFERVERVRIGSPHVVVAMTEALARGDRAVVGYEANGGFLTASPLRAPGGQLLSPLATRDAMLPILATLHAARTQGLSLPELVDRLPARATASGLERPVSPAQARALLASFDEDPPARAHDLFGPDLGAVAAASTLDGVRIQFESKEIVHLRASGNAPEFRCYAEADRADRAAELVEIGLAVVRNLLGGSAQA